jgi:hypothetical protein
VTPEEALTLRLSPGTPVYRFNRLRFADDAPMSVEYATIVATCLPSLEAVQSSLYEALEKPATGPVRALQRLRAVLLDARAGGDAARQSRRRGPPGRKARLPAGRPRSRVLAVLLTAATPTISSLSSALRGERDSRMFQEAADAPAAVRSQLAANRDAVLELGER